MDVPEATLELHSNDCAQKEVDGEQNNGIKAIHVSTGGESQDSDTDDEDNDCSNMKNDEYEAELCKAFTLLSCVDTNQQANKEPEKSERPDESCDNDIDDNDCSLLANASNNDQEHSENDDCNSSSDSSVTLELSSGDEDEPQCFSTDRGGGDADLNSVGIVKMTPLGPTLLGFRFDHGNFLRILIPGAK